MSLRGGEGCHYGAGSGVTTGRGGVSLRGGERVKATIARIYTFTSKATFDQRNCPTDSKISNTDTTNATSDYSHSTYLINYVNTTPPWMAL